MNRTLRLRMLGRLLIVTLAVASLGCPDGDKPTEPRETSDLPSGEDRPEIDVIEFTGPEDGWPPRVRDVTDSRAVAWEPLPGALTDELEAELVESLLADAEVRETLGERFALVGAENVYLDKRDADPRYRFTFYSHSNNLTLQVDVENSERVAMEKLEPHRYQPAPGRDEIDAAIEMARNWLRDKDFPVAELEGGVLLAFPESRPGEVAFYENRVLYVSFSEPEDVIARYFALVDLTTNEVLDGGAAAGTGSV